MRRQAGDFALGNWFASDKNSLADKESFPYALIYFIRKELLIPFGSRDTTSTRGILGDAQKSENKRELILMKFST